MSNDPDTTRIVRSWLDEGVTQLPDRVLDTVLDRLPVTPQRRASWWPARRARAPHTTMAVGLAGAAVLIVITLIGFGIISAERLGGPGTDEATPSATSRATDLPTGSARLEPGRYRLANGFPFDVAFQVPEGWDSCGFSAFEQGVCSPIDGAASVGFLAIENVVVNPCDLRLTDPPAGRSMEAFLSALADLSGFSVTEPVQVTRGGLLGQQVTVTTPAVPQCQELRTWSVPGRTNGVHAGEVNVLDVFDVEGRLLAVVGAYRPGVHSREEIAEIRGIMQSVEIRP